MAPTTLYRLFASKDDLVAGYVERADHRYQQWFHAATEAGAPEPGNQILAVFDALADQVQPRHCRGCPFLMALAEFPDTTHRAHQLAVANKRWVRGRFEHLARQLETTRRADGPSALADHLALLMDGVYASTQALGHTGPAGEPAASPSRSCRRPADRHVPSDRPPATRGDMPLGSSSSACFRWWGGSRRDQALGLGSRRPADRGGRPSHA